MRRRFAVLATAALLAQIALPAAARNIEVIDLAWGYDNEDNVLGGPIFEGASAPPIRFETLEPAYDRQADFVRRMQGGFVRPVKYGLDPAIDIGALWTTVLRNEASTMGLRSSPDAEAVVVRGRVTQAFVENRGVYGGAIIFYGYSRVALELTFPDGRKATVERPFYGMVNRVNGSFGARDEAGEAIARLLVSGAQEIVADLARHHLKAPVHPALPALLDGLVASGVEDRYPALRRVGLAGLPGASEKLLALLGKETEEDNRTVVLDALAIQGDLALEKTFVELYAKDPDEDCRWALLKALAYLDTATARDQIRTLGAKDEHYANRRVATVLLQ